MRGRAETCGINDLLMQSRAGCPGAVAGLTTSEPDPRQSERCLGATAGPPDSRSELVANHSSEVDCRGERFSRMRS